MAFPNLPKNSAQLLNKKKLFNDPVYGFIHIPTELVFDLIEHPLFQRLRRIKQLGLTDLVYPGALHTRFHHALGAMHLMGIATDTLRQKGVDISPEETEAAAIAALLHDLGHGPCSHALEGILLPGVHHEQLTSLYLKQLEQEFGAPVSRAISIFEKRSPKPFLSQLVSGQLDVDRLDYLNRDGFFTGVTEGAIGVENILRMLQVHEGKLVVEEKGIYSIESFLHARRIMYWQVYMHKTSVAAEQMLVALIKRAKQVVTANDWEQLRLTPFLKLNGEIESQLSPNLAAAFASLDDTDVWQAIKFWTQAKDPVIRYLSQSLLSRKLVRCVFSTEKADKNLVLKLRHACSDQLGLSLKDASKLIITGEKTNAGYLSGHDQINILTKSGKVKEISKASDLPNIKALGKVVKKYYLCYPKNLSL